MNETINIAFASDDNYAQHVAVAMASLCRHAAEPGRLQFYVLSDGISQEKTEKLMATAVKLGTTVRIIELTASLTDGLYVSAFLSRTAYVRLSMAELLPVDKVIYLDCDILAQDDIAKLWETDLQGRPLAAVPDFGIMASAKSWRQKKSIMPLKDGMLYFNSGVLLADLVAWRENDSGRSLRELAQQNNFPHHDQDTLNKYFLGKWVPLDLRWNVIPPVFNMFLKVLLRSCYRTRAAAAIRSPGLVHYAGGYKPWEYRRYEGFNDEYYESLNQTAFHDAHMPQPNPKRKHRSIKRQLRRMRWGRFWGRHIY